MLDTPVSGTGSQAANRDLVFYASGDSRAIKRIRSMFQAFGRRVYDVGDFGNGSKRNTSQPAGRHQQRRQRRGHGAGMKAGLRPQTIYDLVRAGAAIRACSSCARRKW